ncbi:hypothetical protein [Streptomyces sp. HB132]|uniref:hypothetical protein n=1 Tax=Streptomyces sp. HB132 TaxID=767388 RepID=UPI001DC61D5C|nr:hypothetical protein [Streptomyces sp. HB132]MBM7443032.1 hypothetical protein [Streptomyces sp. HB132]
MKLPEADAGRHDTSCLDPQTNADQDRVRDLCPAWLPVIPVSRTTYQTGELAQCDLWFPPADVPLGHGQSGRPPVLVMVAGYSRIIAARMLPTRTTDALTDGHWKLLTCWNGAP